MGDDTNILAFPRHVHIPTPAPLPEPIFGRPVPVPANGYTIKLRLDGEDFYLRVTEYDDGTVGELMLDMPHVSPSHIRNLLGTFAAAVSLGLQNGVPLEAYVRLYVNQHGVLGGKVSDYYGITEVVSFQDLVFRILAIRHLQRVDLIQDA